MIMTSFYFSIGGYWRLVYMEFTGMQGQKSGQKR